MLTRRQKQVLNFIGKYQKKHDYAPTLEDIRKHFRLGSVSTAHFHITKLQNTGYLERERHRPRSINIYESANMVKIPLQGTIAAGSPIEAIQENETIAVPEVKLPRTGVIYALRVVGNSMVEENINDGDIVLVKQQSTAERGQKVVAIVDNYEATLKRYYKENGRIRLQPANKELEPIIVKGSQNLLIQGIVIDVIKSTMKPKSHRRIKKQVLRKTRTLNPLLNQIIEGDCLQEMHDIPNKSIDMILCDLPYGTTQNTWDSVIPLDELWQHYKRIIKDNGTIALTAQGLFTSQLMLSNQKLFKYKMVWVKSKATNFLNAKKQPLRKHEDILIFYKKQPDYTPQMSKGEAYNKGFRKNQLTGSYGNFKTVQVKSNGKRYPTDVVYFKTAESEGPVYHPTQKPVELGQYLIKTFTKPGAVVLDNAAGSGSFLVSAVLEERNFIGIEKNQEVYMFKKQRIDYIKICQQRIKQAQENYKRKQAEQKLF